MAPHPLVGGPFYADSGEEGGGEMLRRPHYWWLWVCEKTYRGFFFVSSRWSNPRCGHKHPESPVRYAVNTKSAKTIWPWFLTTVQSYWIQKSWRMVSRQCHCWLFVLQRSLDDRLMSFLSLGTEFSWYQPVELLHVCHSFFWETLYHPPTEPSHMVFHTGIRKLDTMKAALYAPKGPLMCSNDCDIFSAFRSQSIHQSTKLFKNEVNPKPFRLVFREKMRVRYFSVERNSGSRLQEYSDQTCRNWEQRHSCWAFIGVTGVCTLIMQQKFPNISTIYWSFRGSIRSVRSIFRLKMLEIGVLQRGEWWIEHAGNRRKSVYPTEILWPNIIDLGRISCLLWMGSFPLLAFFRVVYPIPAIHLDVSKLFAIVALLRWSFLGVCLVRILNFILYLILQLLLHGLQLLLGYLVC